MTTLTRKQREFQQRQALLLTTARQMLQTQGYLGLTMEKLADAVDYSKGTVYQHFSCKEEVLLQVCIQNLQELSVLFNKAAAFDGYPRERMAALMLAYILFAYLHPEDFSNMQLARSPSIREKTCPFSQIQLEEEETRIHQTVRGIIEAALVQQDLSLPATLLPEEVVFGLWSMSYGGLLILETQCLERKGISNPPRVMRKVADQFLDGLQWRPLASEWDYTASLKRGLEELFAEEYASLSPVYQQQVLDMMA